MGNGLAGASFACASAEAHAGNGAGPSKPPGLGEVESLPLHPIAR